MAKGKADIRKILVDSSIVVAGGALISMGLGMIPATAGLLGMLPDVGVVSLGALVAGGVALFLRDQFMPNLK